MSSKAWEVHLSDAKEDNFDNADLDNLTSIIFRLIRNVEEGVTTKNLRLMICIINGMAEKKKLNAPSFLRYADALSCLTEEDLTVLSVMSKYSSTIQLDGKFIQNPETECYEYNDPEKEELQSTGFNFTAIQQGLVSTGLVGVFAINNMNEDPNQHNCSYFADPETSYSELWRNNKVEYQITSLMHEILNYTSAFIGQNLRDKKYS